MQKIENILNQLAKSKFRSSFHLKQKEKEYIDNKGLETIRNHANDFIRKRLASAYIPNDGRQTPMKGHPVFIAQHATGCCCRSCLFKWHKIPPNTDLTDAQINYIIDLIMAWIQKEKS